MIGRYTLFSENNIYTFTESNTNLKVYLFILVLKEDFYNNYLYSKIYLVIHVNILLAWVLINFFN